MILTRYTRQQVSVFIFYLGRSFGYLMDQLMREDVPPIYRGEVEVELMNNWKKHIFHAGECS